MAIVQVFKQAGQLREVISDHRFVCKTVSAIDHVLP